jgi:hypothetical protein
MDILHDELVDGFCIVSSDSDYTGLAKRIREEGIFAMGIGEKKTPNAFVKSCEIFTFVENLEEKEEDKEEEKVEEKTEKETRKPAPKADKPKLDLKLIKKAFEISANESDEAYISTIGANLRKLDPSFDCRTFGYKTLTQMFKNVKGFVLIDNVINGLNYPLLKRG